MDHRIADRRRGVMEAGARRRARWLLALMAAAAAGGIVAWLLFESSTLAVSEITFAGAARADAEAIAADSGLAAGMPTISVDAEALEAALLADPWVAAAEVIVVWPGAVRINILEHDPIGWVATETGWVLAAIDGSVLEVADQPEGRLATIGVGTAAHAPGDTLGAVEVGALEFVSQLPAELASVTVVSGTADRVTAVVAGHQVELGHPVDMAAKARALAALLDTGIDEGMAINLVSPSRPAVSNPRVPVEASRAGSTADAPTG